MPGERPTDNPHATSIKEIEYSRTTLGAVGTVLLSNHEGYYLGDPLFTPFFSFLDSRPSRQEPIFIHPNSPVLRLNGTLIPDNPSKSSRPQGWSSPHAEFVEGKMLAKPQKQFTPPSSPNSTSTPPAPSSASQSL